MGYDRIDCRIAQRMPSKVTAPDLISFGPWEKAKIERCEATEKNQSTEEKEKRTQSHPPS